MSCSHGWHDCPPCGGWSHGRGWGYGDWPDDPGRFMGRRGREPRRGDSGMAAAELEARLGDLNRMVRDIERDLEDLRGSREGSQM